MHMIVLKTACNLFISVACLCIVLDIFCLFLIAIILYYIVRLTFLNHMVCWLYYLLLHTQKKTYVIYFAITSNNIMKNLLFISGLGRKIAFKKLLDRLALVCYSLSVFCR